MRVPTGRLRIVSTQPSEVAELQEGPPSPGRYIRDQRQRRGMSIEQLAIDTKIPRASIEALEDDRFAALPGPVFVRGFFRCCARSLGLDPESVMALLSEHLRVQQSGARSSRRPLALHPVRTTPPAKPALSAAPSAAAPSSLVSWIEDGGQAVLRILSQLPHTRTLMWIAVCMVIAVVAVTAFAMSGVHVAAPHS